MLENVKSFYFIKIIFSYIKEKRKLNIYESKGKWKEYNDYDDILIFVGEYLNGERNGKRKKYDYPFDYIKFEGEYLNGKRNGKGKEYDYNGYIIFEGEYLNCEMWNGTFMQYDDEGVYHYEIIYKLYYINGEIIRKLTNRRGKLIEEFQNISGFIKEYYDKKTWNLKVII